MDTSKKPPSQGEKAASDGRAGKLQRSGVAEAHVRVEQDGGPSDEQIVQSLKEGLSTLDRMFPSTSPTASWFEQQVAATTKKQRSKLLSDLLKLWLGALVLLYLLYVTATAQPIAFTLLQAAALVAPLAWLLLRKQVDSHE
ncbi:hypothetical protein GCM10008018_49680 [Paenibacillus marchantiophytorum]|uniref:YxlC family protein n=1 Tax=Paenibacillus marchantiophytorum TaxID=1619310 RepID=A0ABQ1F2M3_9BACL|nr:DUF5345 family protein [Paenibacillus marchantiophytorum]GFZ97383.1 hypothetical protein GCM10008018_49680 [Paenibacillus marchantiophytorum]